MICMAHQQKLPQCAHCASTVQTGTSNKCLKTALLTFGTGSGSRSDVPEAYPVMYLFSLDTLCILIHCVCVCVCLCVCVCVLASKAWYNSWRLFPVHPEHIRSDLVHPSGLGGRCCWLARVFYHSLHVLLLCKCPQCLVAFVLFALLSLLSCAMLHFTTLQFGFV